jgi:hypothetical protein
MAAAALKEFRDRLILDDGQRAKLQEAGESGTFFEAAVALAGEWGLEVTREELKEANRAGRRSWMERFL